LFSVQKCLRSENAFVFPVQNDSAVFNGWQRHVNSSVSDIWTTVEPMVPSVDYVVNMTSSGGCYLTFALCRIEKYGRRDIKNTQLDKACTPRFP